MTASSALLQNRPVLHRVHRQRGELRVLVVARASARSRLSPLNHRCPVPSAPAALWVRPSPARCARLCHLAAAGPPAPHGTPRPAPAPRDRPVTGTALLSRTGAGEQRGGCRPAQHRPPAPPAPPPAPGEGSSRGGSPQPWRGGRERHHPPRSGEQPDPPALCCVPSAGNRPAAAPRQKGQARGTGTAASSAALPRLSPGQGSPAVKGLLPGKAAKGPCARQSGPIRAPPQAPQPQNTHQSLLERTLFKTVSHILPPTTYKT